MGLSTEIIDILAKLRNMIKDDAAQLIRRIPSEHILEPIKVLCGSDPHWRTMQIIASKGKIGLEDLADETGLYIGSLEPIVFFLIENYFIHVEEEVFSIHKSIQSIFEDEHEFPAIDVLRNNKNMRMASFGEKTGLSESESKQLIERLQESQIVTVDETNGTFGLRKELSELFSNNVVWDIVRLVRKEKKTSMDRLREATQKPPEILNDKVQKLTNENIVTKRPMYVATRLGDLTYRLISLINAYQIKGTSINVDLKLEKSALRTGQACDMTLCADNIGMWDTYANLRISFPSELEIKRFPEDWVQLNVSEGRVFSREKVFLGGGHTHTKGSFRILSRKAGKWRIESTCEYRANERHEVICKEVWINVKRKMFRTIIICLALISIPTLFFVAYFFPGIGEWLKLSSAVIGVIAGIVALLEVLKRYGKA